MGLQIELKCEEPDYNEILSVSFAQLFPDMEEEKDDSSFMPLLRTAVDIVKDLPQEDKGKVCVSLLNTFLLSEKSPELFRSVERICKSTLDISFMIDRISVNRVESEEAEPIKVVLEIELGEIDYHSVIVKLYEWGLLDNVPFVGSFPNTIKLISNANFVVEIFLPILNWDSVRKKLIEKATDCILSKTGISINDMDYSIS